MRESICAFLEQIIMLIGIFLMNISYVYEQFLLLNSVVVCRFNASINKQTFNTKTQLYQVHSLLSEALIYINAHKYALPSALYAQVY